MDEPTPPQTAQKTNLEETLKLFAKRAQELEKQVARLAEVLQTQPSLATPQLNHKTAKSNVTSKIIEFRARKDRNDKRKK